MNINDAWPERRIEPWQADRLYPSRSSNQLEEATKERLDRKERRLENINKSFSDKPMEFWKREPCTVEMEHTTYYSITPSLSLFTDGIMAQPCSRLVGQALQMPHRYGLCQLVLCLVHTLVDIHSHTNSRMPRHN